MLKDRLKFTPIISLDPAQLKEICDELFLSGEDIVPLPLAVVGGAKPRYIMLLSNILPAEV